MNLNEIENYLGFNYKSVKEKWTGIVIHHSATVDGIQENWSSIKEYHIKKRGWRDIGYHFGIEKVGTKLEYQIGRRLDWNGAHCVGLNQTHLGICLVGNYDEIEPAQEQYEYLSNLIIIIRKFFDIKEVIGHREAIERLKNEPWKSCPGIKFDLDKVRQMI